MQSLHNVDQLTALIAVLEQQENSKRDFVANSKEHLHFVGGNLIVMNEGREVVYKPTDLFHSQIAEKMQIPGGYYGKMRKQAAELLDHNVNHWLRAESKNFLVRAFEGAAEFNQARAFLSDRYSIIDNYQVLIEALEAIKATGLKVEIVNAELSDTRMYLKVVCPDVEISGREMLKNYQVKKGVGDGIISGFTLSNSEVGAGAFNICPRALILTCTNGATMQTDALKNVHLGAKMDELGYSKNKDVMKANLRLIKEQVKHAVKIFLSKEYLEKLVNVYTTLGDPKIEAPVTKVIQVVGKNYDISEERCARILNYFVEGGDTRRMGLANAITLECQGQGPDAKHDAELASFDMLKNFQKIETAALKIKTSAN